MRPQFRKAVALIKVRIQITFALIKANFNLKRLFAKDIWRRKHRVHNVRICSC